MGGTPLTISPSAYKLYFLLHIPVTLCSADIEVIALEEEMLSSEDETVIPLNWKLRLPLHCTGLLMHLNHRQGRDLLCCLG